MIALSREQLDGLLVLEPGLEYRCDSCGEDGERYRQGECEGKLFSVALNPAKKAFVASDTDINVDLCRKHLRLYRGYITWGVSFCSCGGIIERTGRTRPVDTGDGVWEEVQCEELRRCKFCGSMGYMPVCWREGASKNHEMVYVEEPHTPKKHYQAWEVLD